MKKENHSEAEAIVNPPVVQKPTLVDLDREYRTIVSEIEAAGGELTTESEAAFETIAAALCTKVDAYGVVMARLDAETNYWKNQKEHCAKAEKTMSNMAARLKERMRFVLHGHPDKSLQGEFYRFYLKKSRDTLVIDEEKIPGDYKKAKVELVVDRERIEKDLKAGLTVPGAGLKTDNVSLCSGRPQ